MKGSCHFADKIRQILFIFWTRIRQQIDYFSPHFQSQNLGMHKEGVGGFLFYFLFFWGEDVLNPPILQRAPRALHLFSYTNLIRGLITGH